MVHALVKNIEILSREHVQWRIFLAFLVGTFSFTAPVSADSSTTESSEIHYFREGGSAAALEEILNPVESVCMDAPIASSHSENMSCDESNKLCSTDAKFELVYFDRDYLLTPYFDLRFPEVYEFDVNDVADTKFSYKSGEQTSIVLHATIRLSGLNSSAASSLSKCVREIGGMLSGKLSPYSVVLPNLNTKGGGSVQDTRNIDDVDGGIIRLSYPKDIAVGAGFTLEAILIPGKRWGMDQAALEDIKEVRNAQRDLRRLEKEYQAGNVDFGAVKNRVSSMMAALSERPPPTGVTVQQTTYQFASMKLSATGMEAELVTGATKLDLKPLSPAIWTWVITPNRSHKGDIYLSLTLSNANGSSDPKIIPVTINVSETNTQRILGFLSEHIEWIIGTLIVPVLAYFWGRRGKNDSGVERAK